MSAALVGATVAFVPHVPATAVDPRPNIVIIVTDDQRADQQGVMARTNEWFGRDGVVFPFAYAETPLCCPSRSTVFSGKYTHNHGVKGNRSTDVARLDQSATIQRALRDAGYQTGITGKYFNAWSLANNPPYFDRWAIMRGGYVNTAFNVNGVQQTVAQYSTDYLGDQATAMIDAFKRQPDKPFFLYVAPSTPHWPYTPSPVDKDANVGELAITPSMNELDKTDKPSWIANWTLPNPGYTVADASRWQRRALLSVDRMVDRVMQQLPPNTLAFFLSDNGYMLGEHGVREDKRLPYAESVRVPMMLRWPGRVTPKLDYRAVLNADIAPTIAAATGVSAALPNMDGRDLLSTYSRTQIFLESFPTQEHASDFGYPAWRSLINPKGQYIEWLSPTNTVLFREFYDVKDKYQMANMLITNPAVGGTLAAPMQSAVVKFATCRGTTGTEACP